MKRIVHRIGSMCEFSIGGFLPWSAQSVNKSDSFQRTRPPGVAALATEGHWGGVAGFALRPALSVGVC
jgi:hypothetical protein